MLEVSCLTVPHLGLHGWNACYLSSVIDATMVAQPLLRSPQLSYLSHCDLNEAKPHKK